MSDDPRLAILGEPDRDLLYKRRRFANGREAALQLRTFGKVQLVATDRDMGLSFGYDYGY